MFSAILGGEIPVAPRRSAQPGAIMSKASNPHNRSATRGAWISFFIVLTLSADKKKR
jgi:hypothetical protein